ncbi:hypothetical protein [Methylopila turkensis]|nr:hypothetical protein [Methylopila turkensis]
MTITQRARRAATARLAAGALIAAVAAGGAAAQDQTAAGPATLAQAGAGGGPKTPLPAPTPRAEQPGQGRAAQGKPGPDSDWPCIQPKVGALSYGQMWAGPPLDEAIAKWRDDPHVADLVPLLVARRTKRDEAQAAIDRFTAAAGPEKNAQLTLLFAGVFSEINAARSAVITGIERYARKQRALSERIKEASLKLAAERKDMATQMSPEFQKKEEALNWDTRIYDERAQALTYVCESPVILEQLAFERGRDIQAKLDN